MKITVKHYYQDFNAEQITEGDIDAETITDTYEMPGDGAHLSEFADEIEREVFWVGEWSGPAETSDGGETIYYNCQWPTGFRVGDPQHRSGSLCISGASPRVLEALVKRWGIYT